MPPLAQAHYFHNPLHQFIVAAFIWGGSGGICSGGSARKKKNKRQINLSSSNESTKNCALPRNERNDIKTKSEIPLVG